MLVAVRGAGGVARRSRAASRFRTAGTRIAPARLEAFPAGRLAFLCSGRFRARSFDRGRGGRFDRAGRSRFPVLLHPLRLSRRKDLERWRFLGSVGGFLRPGNFAGCRWIGPFDFRSGFRHGLRTGGLLRFRIGDAYFAGKRIPVFAGRGDNLDGRGLVGPGYRTGGGRSRVLCRAFPAREARSAGGAECACRRRGAGLRFRGRRGRRCWGLRESRALRA